MAWASVIYWNHVSHIKHFPSTSNKSALVDIQTLLQLYSASSIAHCCKHSFIRGPVAFFRSWSCGKIHIAPFWHICHTLICHQIEDLLCLNKNVKSTPFHPLRTERTNSGRIYFWERCLERSRHNPWATPPCCSPSPWCLSLPTAHTRSGLLCCAPKGLCSTNLAAGEDDTPLTLFIHAGLSLLTPHISAMRKTPTF